MDWVVINIFIIVMGLGAMVALPMYFRRKNAREALRLEYEEYIKQMIRIDKQYNGYLRELSNNLNIINYWLKTGIDPTESEEDSEKVEQENRFFAGLMSPVEAKKWKNAVEKAKMEDTEDSEVKAKRVGEFEATGMEPLDVDQTEMKFFYSEDYGENIYYCVTPEALEKKQYKYVIFFTTARTANIPLVYPFKYEGAQMLSLYKHPSQTVWFLKNWKSIREGLEGAGVSAPRLDASVTKEFDL